MSKFKVGDKVKVTYKISSSARELNGKICIIDSIETIDGSTLYAILKEELSFNREQLGVWFDEIELVKENMSKFKVGDKVRCLKNFGSGYKFGEIYEVHSVYNGYNECRINTVCDSNGNNFNSWGEENFELVTNSLEELVKKANDGYEAIYELYQNHWGNVEFKDDTSNWGTWFKDHIIKGRQFRIKQKPFGPFKVGQNWEVSLQGDTIKIGCKQFDARSLFNSLMFLNAGKSIIAGNYNMYATRQGVKFESHEISWEDSDKIIEALNKAGYK